MPNLPWSTVVVAAAAVVSLLVFAFPPHRKFLHVVFVALGLTLVAVVILGSVDGFGGWDAESRLALGVTWVVLWGVPMLSAAVTVVLVKRLSSSKVLMSCAAVAAVALAALPAFWLAHSVSCGWVGECL